MFVNKFFPEESQRDLAGWFEHKISRPLHLFDALGGGKKLFYGTVFLF